MRNTMDDWANPSGRDPFMDVIGAVASYNRRPRYTREQLEAMRAEAHKKDPRHIAALKRRRKRKRGGPK